MHFPDPVDAVVLGVQPCNLAADQLIRQRSRRQRAAFCCPKTARGQESHPSYSHNEADELDLDLDLDLETILRNVDEDDQRGVGRPSSVAKSTLADRRIPHALSRSAICSHNQSISACVSDDVRGSRPASMSAHLLQSRNVLGFTASRPAAGLAAAKPKR